MKIIKFEKQYVQEVKNLSDTLFEDGWTIQQFDCELSNNSSYVLLLQNQQKIIGFVFARILFDELEILNIGIQKQFQGQKLAKKLLQQVLDYAKTKTVTKAFLEVRQDNLPALALYKSVGFEVNRLRKNYYGNCDGVEMIKNI